MASTNFFKRSELAAALGAFRREFLAVGLFSMAGNLMMLAPTLYMLQVFDRVLSSRSELTLLSLSLFGLFFLAVMAFSEWMRSRVLVRAGVRFDHQLSSRVFDASFESYLTQTKAGASRAFTDLLTLRQFLTGQGIFAFFDVPWAPIYLALTFFLHPVLGWSAVAFMIVQASLTWASNRRTVAPAEEASKAAGDVQAYLHSKLRNVEVIESMGMLGNLRRRWRDAQDVALAHNAYATDISSRAMALSKFIRYTQQSFSLAVGAVLVIRGELSPGAMVAANMMMARALSPIDQLVSVWRAFATARAAFERLEELLNEYPERDANLRRVAPQGGVLLRDVIATAPGRDSPILKGINFSVPVGTTVAVLGPSGSGKSTLARVIMGIWPNVSGEVLLDGLPIDGWNRTELGPHLGYLPQDIELFDGSIAENIARFGEVDSQKVIAAARCAGLHEMILHFPKGYDTPIGEAGNLLSGGQKQRIGLARAVYGDPAVLVLDEPNANLDDAGEAALLRTVQQLKAAGKTIFLVTHRPGIVNVADRILILQDGQLRMDGPRDAVIAALRPPAVAHPAPPESVVAPA